MKTIAHLQDLATERLNKAALSALRNPETTLHQLREIIGEQKFGALLTLASIQDGYRAGDYSPTGSEIQASLPRIAAEAISVNPEFFKAAIVRRMAPRVRKELFRISDEYEVEGQELHLPSHALERRGFRAVATSPVIRFDSDDETELLVDFRLLDEDFEPSIELELSLPELLTVSYASLTAARNAVEKAAAQLKTKTPDSAQTKSLLSTLDEVGKETAKLKKLLGGRK